MGKVREEVADGTARKTSDRRGAPVRDRQGVVNVQVPDVAAVPASHAIAQGEDGRREACGLVFGQHPAVPGGKADQAFQISRVGRRRLLQDRVAAGGKDFAGDRGVGGRRSRDVDDVGLRLAGQPAVIVKTSFDAESPAGGLRRRVEVVACCNGAHSGKRLQGEQVLGRDPSGADDGCAEHGGCLPVPGLRSKLGSRARQIANNDGAIVSKLRVQ
jgi:hypothetical protein